jgi:hypothetical protein
MRGGRRGGSGGAAEVKIFSSWSPVCPTACWLIRLPGVPVQHCSGSVGGRSAAPILWRLGFFGRGVERERRRRGSWWLPVSMVNEGQWRSIAGEDGRPRTRRRRPGRHAGRSRSLHSEIRREMTDLPLAGKEIHRPTTARYCLDKHTDAHLHEVADLRVPRKAGPQISGWAGKSGTVKRCRWQ